MYKLSDIISKQVIALRGAQLLGTVADIRFDGALKKADSLLLMDGEENDETYLRLPVKSVTTMKEDSVVVKSLSSPLKPDLLPANNPVNLPCCNQDGKVLGHISDIEFSDTFETTAFIVGGTSYPIDMLLSFSDCLVIFNDSGSPIKLPKPKAKKPRPADKNVTAKVTATSLPPQTTENQPTADMTEIRQESRSPVTTPTAAPSPAPEFGTPDFSFLLGKRVTQNLCSTAGRLIAAKNTVITEDIIADAGRENKLVQLTLRAI